MFCSEPPATVETPTNAIKRTNTISISLLRFSEVSAED